MKVALFGTPDFAIPSLDALVKSKDHDVVCVVTQPDRPSGRGQGVTISAVKEYALENNIPVLQPPKINNELNLLDGFAPDVIVVAAFGQILRPHVLEYCRYGCINVHASLLPKYRGASPIQWAIIRGERETGITIMQMDPGVDTGDIIHQASCDIAPNETAGELSARLAVLGASALLTTLDEIERGTAKRTPQNGALATPAPMLTKEMARIGWKNSAFSVANFVRGMRPWPTAWFMSGTSDVRVHAATPFTYEDFSQMPFASGIDTNASVGAVLHACSRYGLFVNCLGSVIRLDVIQLPGGRPINAKDFLNGRTFAPGAIF